MAFKKESKLRTREDMRQGMVIFEGFKEASRGFMGLTEAFQDIRADPKGFQGIAKRSQGASEV